MEVGGEKQPFLGLTDLPMYGRGPGWMKTCQNFRVMPGGYLEARGGFDAIKPSGGTAADPISAGIFTGGHEHTMADGYIYKANTGGTVFTGSFAQRAYWDIWAGTQVANDAIYVISDGRFSRIVFYIAAGEFGATAPTFAYEFWNGSTWTALTTTSTPTFEDAGGGGSTGEQVLEFAISTTWVPAAVNGVYGYAIRIRVTNSPSILTQDVSQSVQKVYCDWPGARQIYVYSANAAAATNNATLKYYGQSSASVAAWQSVSTALFSGNFARARFSSYRNTLYLVNGKEQKRWDQHTLSDIGFTAPSFSSSATTAAASAGSGLGTGTWQYAMTLGYGPAGEWGESGYTAIGDAEATTAGANDGVNLQWTFTSTPASGIVDTIYIYRTGDLSVVPSSARSTMPYYRIATLTRDAEGVLPEANGTVDYFDEVLAFPIGATDLNAITLTPPSRCKFIGVHKNRLFLGGNNQYPGRVWWSEPFEAEAFNQDENFADLTRRTGGQLTGMIEFGDQMVCFTEDKMFGISNVDQDQPNIYEIPTGVGCIAPDSIAESFGVLCWLARNGAYVWDGNDPPRRVSDHTSATLGAMSFEGYGGSRGVIHNRMYEIHLINNNNTMAQSDRLRYDLVNDTWGTVTFPSLKAWVPLCVATMPLAHVDAGVRHPVYGQGDKSFSDYAIYVGEVTTQDAAVSYVCAAQVHFGPTGLTEAILDKVFCYYYATDGWGTPAISLPNATTNFIGSPTGALTNLTGDAATDYTRLSGIPAEGSLGSGDLLVYFSVSSAASGTVRGQRLLSLGADVSGVPSDWGKS